jgi:hypothetical protein
MNRIAFLLPLALTFAVGCGATSSLQTVSGAAPSNITGFDPCDFVVCKWNDLGPTGVKWVEEISVVLDAKEYPIIAWISSFNGEVQVKRWTGNAWQSLGGVIGVGAGKIGQVKLALEKDGTPVVAYNQYLGGKDEVLSRVIVTRWTGKAWQDYAGTPCGGFCYDLWRLDMTLDASDHPVVAFNILPGLSYSKNESQLMIRSAIWNGTGWTSYQNLTGGYLDAIGVNKFNQTFIKIEGPYSSKKAYVFKLIGNNWSQIGNFDGSYDYTYLTHPEMQFDKNGSPVFDIYGKVYRWNGSSFSELGIDGGYTVVTNSDGDIFALKWVIEDPSLPCYDYNTNPSGTPCYTQLRRYDNTNNKWIVTNIHMFSNFRISLSFYAFMSYRVTKTGQPIQMIYEDTYGDLYVSQRGPPPVLTQP